jgi:hypothetical protein
MVAPSKTKAQKQLMNRRWETNSCAYSVLKATEHLGNLACLGDLGPNPPQGLIDSVQSSLRDAKYRVSQMDMECRLFLDDLPRQMGDKGAPIWKALDDAIDAGDWDQVSVRAMEVTENLARQMEAIMMTSPPSYQELMPKLESDITDLWENCGGSRDMRPDVLRWM